MQSLTCRLSLLFPAAAQTHCASHESARHCHHHAVISPLAQILCDQLPKSISQPRARSRDSRVDMVPCMHAFGMPDVVTFKTWIMRSQDGFGWVKASWSSSGVSGGRLPSLSSPTMCMPFLASCCLLGTSRWFNAMSGAEDVRTERCGGWGPTGSDRVRLSLRLVRKVRRRLLGIARLQSSRASHVSPEPCSRAFMKRDLRSQMSSLSMACYSVAVRSTPFPTRLFPCLMPQGIQYKTRQECSSGGA